jgi:Fe-S-cluster-containing dehydrogenase component
LQGLVAIANDGREMHKNIRAVIAADKSEALGIVKPLYCSHHVEPPCITKCPTVAGWVARSLMR